MTSALIRNRLINVGVVWLSLFMVGCLPHWFDSNPPLPVQPDAPTKADNMTTVGDQIDKSDARVAAAVTVAQRVVVFSGRPGAIKAITAVDIPGPRDPFKVRFEPQFQQAYEQLWAILAPEIAKGEEI